MNTLKKKLIAILVLGISLIPLKGFGDTPEKVGVLVLAHGGSAAWNQQVEEAVKPVRNSFPVEIAFGMALPRTIQEGIDKLEAQGVNKIVVVPLFISQARCSR